MAPHGRMEVMPEDVAKVWILWARKNNRVSKEKALDKFRPLRTSQIGLLEYHEDMFYNMEKVPCDSSEKVDGSPSIIDIDTIRQKKTARQIWTSFFSLVLWLLHEGWPNFSLGRKRK